MDYGRAEIPDRRLLDRGARVHSLKGFGELRGPLASGRRLDLAGEPLAAAFMNGPVYAPQSIQRTGGAGPRVAEPGASGSARSGSPAARRRVLILDHQPVTRLGVVQLVNGEADLTVCGEAADARQALSLIEVASPNLVVAEIAVPGLSIIDFIKDVRTRWPELPVLILSNCDEMLYAERMLQAGARGYVMKREAGSTLLTAFRQVLEGRRYLSETMTTVAFEALGCRGEERTAGSVLRQLSDREFEVLRCLADGRTTREAAAELGISAKTVETHRLSLCRKLGLRSPAELIRFAVHWDESGARGGTTGAARPAAPEHSADSHLRVRPISPAWRMGYSGGVTAAATEDPVSPDFVDLEADFGWLLPWMTLAGRFEIGELRATFGAKGVAPAELPGPELALAALHVSERLLRQFFDDSPISVVVFEPAGRLVHVNGAFCALVGCAAEDLVARNIEELIHPDDVASVQERRRLLLEGRFNRFQIAARFAPANRREVWTRMCGRLERYGGDRPPHIFAHIVESTALHDRPEDLRRAAEESQLKNWDPERYM
jgi:PAS domain S-box-containing protein